MFHILIQRKIDRLTQTAFALGLPWILLIFPQVGRAASPTSTPGSLESGFHEMYNLNFAAAHKTFEEWEVLHPDDPLGAASNAAAYLFAEFERLHILEFDLFTENRRVEDAQKQIA